MLQMIDDLLRISLNVAVPMWIEKIKAEGWDWERIQERAQVCAEHIAAHGDVLQFGGKKGEAAEAFNRLAEGLACASFAPDGVSFLGLRFQAN